MSSDRRKPGQKTRIESGKSTGGGAHEGHGGLPQ